MPVKRASCGPCPTPHGPVFWRCTIDSLNASDDVPVRVPARDAHAAVTRRDAIRRRWTLHGLNNGAIFTATYRLVNILPRVVSYAVGRVGTWIAWRLMHETRAAIASNLRPLFPADS